MSTSFLGTMAGTPTMLIGNNHRPTYSRIYESFGGSDDLRNRISVIGNDLGGAGYKDIGDSYSYTPYISNRNPYSMQGGGFFLTVKTYEEDDQERFLNCFAYAIGTFKNELEVLSKKSIEDLQKSVSYEIDHIVAEYFDNTNEPKDGDLAIYSVSGKEKVTTPSGILINPGTTHAGIYQTSQPNWNSPGGGTVRSKWGFIDNYYVFQHDLFFTPHFYGNQIRFFKIKKIDE